MAAKNDEFLSRRAKFGAAGGIFCGDAVD